MPKRALAEHRPWLLASLIAGVSYFFVMDEPLGGIWLMVWKGAGVALLAIYAVQRGRGLDGALVALVMAFGAAGDVSLEISFLMGGILFAVGHLVAIALYWRNRRPLVTQSQKIAAIALLVITPLIAGLLTWPLPNWQIATAYAALVGAMAGMAWSSRFPRYRVGIGAVLFVISDLLIFAKEAEQISGEVTAWLIWPLYYGAQFLIATGAIKTLRAGRA